MNFRSEGHRRFIASLPCIVTGKSDVQAAHVRLGADGGTGLKPSDFYCVPLSVQQHRLQHEIGEEEYWRIYGGTAKIRAIAISLHHVSGDRERALQIINDFKVALINEWVI